MIYDALTHVDTIDIVDPGVIPQAVFDRDRPAVMRGLVSHWPAVEHPAENFDALKDYLSKFWIQRPVTAYVAPPKAKGRFGYNEAFNGFNFQSGAASLADIIERIKEAQSG